MEREVYNAHRAHVRKGWEGVVQGKGMKLLCV